MALPLDLWNSARERKRRAEALERIIASHSGITMDAALKRVEEAYRWHSPLVVKVSGDALVPERMPETAQYFADLSVLFPVVLVHGTGEVLNRRLHSSNKHMGTRITPPHEIPIVREVTQQLTLNFAYQLMIRYKGRALPVVPTDIEPVFTFDHLEYVRGPDKTPIYLGEVGVAQIGKEVKCMRESELQLIRSIVNDGTMPVLGALVHGLVSHGEYKTLNGDADDVARVVARLMNPEWLIFLTENVEKLADDVSTEDYMVNYYPEKIRDAVQLKHYRNGPWKIVAAVETAKKGVPVAMMKTGDFFPFLFSPKPIDYENAVLVDGYKIRHSELLNPTLDFNVFFDRMPED